MADEAKREIKIKQEFAKVRLAIKGYNGELGKAPKKVVEQFYKTVEKNPENGKYFE